MGLYLVSYRHHRRARIDGPQLPPNSDLPMSTLRTEERGIRAEERAFKADGKFDKTERKVVKQDLNQTSRQIYRQKHDAQKRPPQPATPPTV